MKSDPSYVLSSVKKLEIVLQAMPEVQESQGFKTLHNNLTLDLEKKSCNDYAELCTQGQRHECQGQEREIPCRHLQMDT